MEQTELIQNNLSNSDNVEFDEYLSLRYYQRLYLKKMAKA